MMSHPRYKSEYEEPWEEPEKAIPHSDHTECAENNEAHQTDKLDQILAAITVTRERLESKIDGVTEGLNLLRDDHRKLKERVAQSEKTLSHLQPSVTEIRDQVRN